MTDFKTYRDGTGGRTAYGILGAHIDTLQTWAAFSELVRQVCHDPRAFNITMFRAEMLFKDDSNDDRAVILATLFAMDYSGEAIKLADQYGVNFLGMMNHVGRDAREAVAACLIRRDR